MDIESRIRALEEQLAELRVGNSKSGPKQIDMGSPLNFTFTKAGGNPVHFLILNPDGTCMVNGKETRSSLEIGEAVLRFQATRINRPENYFLPTTSSGDA